MTAPSAPAASPEVRADSANSAQPATPFKPGYGGVILAVIGITILTAVAVLVGLYLITGLGVTAFTVAGVLALIPLVIVLLGIRWIDRWEPEPRGALVFAFLWGAGMAVLVALLVDASVQNTLNALGGSREVADFLGAVIQAPLVEEGAKGFGILVIFWFARRHFDGPVDGVVYAATIAAGFAFSENILYFGGEIVQRGGVDGDVIHIFIVRGLLSPFAHVMFTSMTGLLLGLAAQRTNWFGAIGFYLLGLVPASLLHALWNGSLYFVSDFFSYYAIVQVPLFIGVVLLVVSFHRKEVRLTQARLGEYADAGWFAHDEVPALATGPGRRAAMAWARQRGVGTAMKRYIRDATRLALARQRLVSGRGALRAQADEQALLARILAERSKLRV